MTISKNNLLISIGALLIVFSGIVFFITQPAVSQPSREILEECNVLEYNGPDKINIVFFSEEDNAEKYKNFLLDSRPFDDKREAFNFFYINNYEPECDLYKGVAILCYSRELVTKSASCPNDYIVVLSDEDSTIRSSSYLSVMSLNLKHVLTVFLHEFGHSFANLAEEYVNGQNPLKGSLNCVEECSAFDSQTDGCFQGCSKSDLYRSVDKGVMKTLSPRDQENPFGVYNADLITRTIEEIVPESEETITGLAIEDFTNTCANDEYVLIETQINTETNEFSITSDTLHKGCSTNAGSGSNKFSVTREGEEIASGNFNSEFNTDGQDENENLEGEKYPIESIYFKVPQGDKITLSDEDGVFLASEIISDAGARPCLT